LVAPLMVFMHSTSLGSVNTPNRSSAGNGIARHNLRHGGGKVRLNRRRCCILLLVFVAFFITLMAVVHSRVVVASTQKNRDGRGQQKTEEIDGRVQMIPRQQNPKGGAFIHMGKTGGSTLSVLLKNGCHSYMPHPCRNVTMSSMASDLVESYYHVPDFGLLQQSHHDFYLVTVRDPFDRALSSFVYEHYRNRVARTETMNRIQKIKYRAAYRCFPTLDRFVSLLPLPEEIKGKDLLSTFEYDLPQFLPVPEDASCRDVARAALYGKIRVFTHLFFSYSKIRSLLPEDLVSNARKKSSKIYVTRQEHLWSDWKTINRMLEEEYGGKSQQRFRDQEPDDNAFSLATSKADQEELSLRNTTHMELLYQLPVKREIKSQAGVERLCSALNGEYQAYLWFLGRARNLQGTNSVKEAIDYIDTKRNCTDLATSLREWVKKQDWFSSTAATW